MTETSKVYYPIEEQLTRISEEVGDYHLAKPAEEMSEEEIRKAEEEATKYVEWVKDAKYIQLVPMLKGTGQRIYP